MRLSNAVFCVRGQKKRLLRNFVPKTRLTNSWLNPEYHTFLIVFTRTAPNVIKLNATLTTVSWKKLCTKQIVTKPDTAKKSTKQTKLQSFHPYMSTNLSLQLFANLFVPKTRLKNSWLSQSVIIFSLYSHELLETFSIWMLLWLPFQEKGFVLNKLLLKRILQKVYKTNETSNPPRTHVIKLVSTSIDSTATNESGTNLRKKIIQLSIGIFLWNFRFFVKSFLWGPLNTWHSF